MDKLQTLLSIINNDEDVRRFKELESLIDHNKEIQQTYQALLSLQKEVVKSEHMHNDTAKIAEKAYQEGYEKLLSFAPMQEYLDLLDLLNADLGLIKDIIEKELSLDFD